MERIAHAFASAKSAGRPAWMPFYPLGFPNRGVSLDVIQACTRNGADLLELGMPFSDPLADGPTIQYASQVALEQGITPAICLAMVAELRQRGITQPLVLMGYYNPILAFGPERFVDEAGDVGASGLIIPDLPPEEASILQEACRASGLALVFLASPNSTMERLALLASQTRGFLYLVSLMGVTGARDDLPPDLADFIRRARSVAETPLAVGFGISTSEQVLQVGTLADGVIVGSALVKAVESALATGDNPAHAAGQFIRSLQLAT